MGDQRRLERLIEKMQVLATTFQALADEYERESQTVATGEMSAYYKNRSDCYAQAAKWLRNDLDEAVAERGASVG